MNDFDPSSDAASDADAPALSPGDFAAQLLPQLYADLNGVLGIDTAAAADAWAVVRAAAAAGRPRGASLWVLTGSAIAAHQSLLGDGHVPVQQPGEHIIGATLAELIPEVADCGPALARYARRLTRYFAEAEPAGAALPEALSQAITRLYQGLLDDDERRSHQALIALRTMTLHIDAVASLLDPADTGDQPIRVFAPDRFHDHFLFLTERVQQNGTDDSDRPVAALSHDGRITALITQAEHPLEAAAEALRERIPGDPTSKEHGLFRMQGLLRYIEALRGDNSLPLADALHDELAFLSLVTAAATTPMQAPGRFGVQQLAQVARYNVGLLSGGAASLASRPATARPGPAPTSGRPH